MKKLDYQDKHLIICMLVALALDLLLIPWPTAFWLYVAGLYFGILGVETRRS